MQLDEFKYDVAFSFVAADEALAVELNDLLCGRIRTFLYSQRQEEIAGTDGETSFNDVFAKQARCVVVLYRRGWGETSWTRIEETAIRNRAHEDGYDFALFIPLDSQPTVPKWLPKNRLWIGLDRWGAKGAAAVIEGRAQELGALPHLETLEDRAARHARHAAFESDKSAALNDYEGTRAFRSGAMAVMEGLRQGVERLNLAQKTTTFSFLRYNDTEPLAAAFVLGLSSGFSLNALLPYANSLENAFIEATIWQDSPPLPHMRFFEPPQKKITRRYRLGYSTARAYVWLPDQGSTDELSDSAAAESMLRWYIDNG